MFARLGTPANKNTKDVIGNFALDAFAVGPNSHSPVFGCNGTEELWIRYFSDSAEIEPVGIKTGLYSYIRVGCCAGVETASLMQQVEFQLVQFGKQSVPQLFCQFCTTGTMLRVTMFIKSPCIVEQGKKLYDFLVSPGLPGKPHAYLVNPGPVTNPMVAKPVYTNLILYRFY